MNATAIPDESVFDATINAVMIYDDFTLAAKANAMLKRVATLTKETQPWSVMPWRLDILKLAPAAEAALAEAVGAHLILLAIRQVQSLASWLLDWLERWARCRQVLEAALAVWDGENTDIISARATPELLKFAKRHGLSLIRNDDGLAQTREIASAPTFRRIIAGPRKDSHQHWGINE